MVPTAAGVIRQVAAFLNSDSSGATATGTLRCKELVWTGSTRPAGWVCSHRISNTRGRTSAAYEVNTPSLAPVLSGAFAFGSLDKEGSIENASLELSRERRYRVASSKKTSAPESTR